MIIYWCITKWPLESNTSWDRWYKTIIPVLWKTEAGKSKFWAHPGQQNDTCLKRRKEGREGGGKRGEEAKKRPGWEGSTLWRPCVQSLVPSVNQLINKNIWQSLFCHQFPLTELIIEYQIIRQENKHKGRKFLLIVYMINPKTKQLS